MHLVGGSRFPELLEAFDRARSRRVSARSRLDVHVSAPGSLSNRGERTSLLQERELVPRSWRAIAKAPRSAVASDGKDGNMTMQLTATKVAAAVKK